MMTNANPLIEIHMDANPPYVIAPVDNPAAVEAAMPKGWCVGIVGGHLTLHRSKQMAAGCCISTKSRTCDVQNHLC